MLRVGLGDQVTIGLTPPSAGSARFARLTGNTIRYGTINHAFCQHTRQEGTKKNKNIFLTGLTGNI